MIKTTLIAMAGEGKRFQDENFADPKPLIQIDGTEMFVKATNCLPQTENHVFITKQDFDDKNINQIIKVFEFKGNNKEKLNFIKSFILSSKIGIEGIKELENITKYKNNITIDFSLARGLSYYTSSIFEVISDDINQGSLAGGGRYDNLTEIFGLKDCSGIGVSFGLERIFNTLEENKLFPKEFEKSIQVMVTNLGEDLLNNSLDVTKMLKENLW